MEMHRKEGTEEERQKESKRIENTREKHRNSLWMSEQIQREYEGVKPDNIVKRPGQSTKAISSRVPNHF